MGSTKGRARLPAIHRNRQAGPSYGGNMRRIAEIQEAAGEYLDRVWYVRHQNLACEIEDGTVTLVDIVKPGEYQTTCSREIWEGAKASARRCEEQYGKDTLGPINDWD